NQSLTTQAGDLEIAGASDFGALTWLSLTEETLKNSPKSVLAIASKVQNAGMLWEGTNTIRDQWGSAPTEMAALQVSLILSVDADSLQIFPLSATGKEGDYETFLPLIPGKFFINIDQSETQTTWFGIRAFGTLVKVESAEPEKMQVEVFPNPAFENLVVAGKWQEGKSMKISLLDATGKEIFAEQTIVSEGGDFQKTFPVGNFPSGLYLVKIQSGENLILKKVVVR
ncbi:MAG TPA: T9SS type A sorting domain-containing protein, partial [Saprospiraceae bacterium]|nr:T9SS type A sorting domain-containing protein [Saprospiraceae bacterium]